MTRTKTMTGLLRSVSVVLLFLFFGSSCSISEIVDKKTSNVYFGSIENNTKTVLDGYNIVWREGDKIEVYSNNSKACYTYNGITGESSGDFVEEFKNSTSVGGLSHNIAIYPYSISSAINSGMAISYSIPSKQNYEPNSFGNGVAIMTAVTESIDSRKLCFKNVMAFIKLKLYGSANVCSITLQGNKNEVLSGECTISFDSEYYPVLSMEPNGENKIMIDCGESGIAISNNKNTPTAVWIAIPPITFEEGFSVSIKDVKGNTYEKSTSKRISIARSYVHSMSVIEILSDENLLDGGKCGPELYWSLYNNGLLKISGSGPSYDYVKGVLIDKTKEEIENYAGPSYYGFQPGKNYDHENGQYAAPWYRYRDEVDFDDYTSHEAYDSHNPKGWKYNSVSIDPGITYIGDWLFYRCCAEELTIPEGVKEIADWGIRYSPTLKRISIPSSVKKLGNNGISRNIVAEVIELGNGLETIGENALGQNTKVKSIVLPSSLISIGGHAMMANSEVRYVDLGSVSVIPERTLISAYKLEDVVVPESVHTIDEYAFYQCKALKRVIIPSNVETIGGNAFLECTSLEDVYIKSQTIANKVSNNGSSNGYLTKYAKRIYIHNSISCPYAESSLHYDGIYGEYKQYSSWSDYKEEGLVSAGVISPGVFYKLYNTLGNGDYTLYLGSNTSGTYSGTRQCVFYSNKSKIKKIIVPNNVSITTSDFFNGYENLEEADIAMTDIPQNFFINCKNLTKLTLREGVKTIGSYAFFNTSITHLVIPESVVTIADRVAHNTIQSDLQSVTIGSNVESVGAMAFIYYKNVSIPANNKLSSIGEQAFYASKGLGILYLPQITTLSRLAFYKADSFSEIVIGNKVESIGDNAFAFHIGTVTINREKSLITIGSNAFGKASSVVYKSN